MCTSCTAVNKAAYKIEGTHNALYKQKVLFVYAVEDNKVLFVNPTGTRCYFLKGKQYIYKWAPGDTLIIDKDLESFYNLRFAKNCN
jgi:hypothetical protein